MNNENENSNSQISENNNLEQEDLFLSLLKKNLGPDFELNSQEEHEPYIIVDSRESKKIIEELENLGAIVFKEPLPISDYLLSSKVAVERKRGDDFYSSLIRGSESTNLFEELRRLKEFTEIPILIIENFELMFSINEKMVTPLYGAMVAIATQLKISIIPVRNYQDTAIVLYRIAKQQQGPVKEHAIPRRIPKESLKERQAYFLEGFFNVGPTKAKILINHFKSPMNFINSLLNTEIIYTKSGKPKGIKGPLADLKGFGWKFVMENKNFLLNEKDE